ncbi:hypothetical protein CMQ_2920 [Grosmannia clavigera kw1407]|uniref:Uncharacterized protein n=1 Tax=Grosmannia clavigera (strain kw1407 / UAMH 11150) TaxID=655863 RepID=F0XHT9_GROCL|nr:uncharacterized protein CMQ_2920 [Grosmannia clavigera kw1407]EFX02991.1 hypothetical protein CMQ_2920 [Grosmannia clavigera kw1407]
MVVPRGKDHGGVSLRSRQASGQGNQRFYFVNVLSDYVADHYLMPHAGSGDVYHEASMSLPQLDAKPTKFRDLLLRMSLKDDSASSRALLYSIFCLSAVRRYGNVQECSHFKTLALQALQHATTKTTLTVSQIALGDQATVFWAMYICNLRTILVHAFVDPLPVLSLNAGEIADAFILLRYVHYHDVLAQFSIDHWRRPADLLDQLSVMFKGKQLKFRCSQASDIKLVFLKTELEEAFSKSKKACRNAVDMDGSDPSVNVALQRFLFLSACWIYFQRACRYLSGPSVTMDSLLVDVFSMASHIQRMGVRITPFSLFMIGSEARTEESRRSILDLVNQPQGIDDPSTNCVNLLLSAVWAQDDLHDSTQGYLDYITKMEWVITARPVLPALV